MSRWSPRNLAPTHTVETGHRQLSPPAYRSKQYGITSYTPFSDTNVANQVIPLPYPTYVSKHTPALSITLSPPKGVFKHQPDLQKLINPANSTSNGCIQASMLSTRQPSFHPNGSHSSPLLWVNHAQVCIFPLWVAWSNSKINKKRFMQPGIREFSSNRVSSERWMTCQSAVRGNNKLQLLVQMCTFVFHSF